ncbi:hypothetical protein GCM10027035_47740 [Emticicia sediminis]
MRAIGIIKKMNDNPKINPFSISWIKDNYSIIALVPLIIGGIWQVVVLMSISISYLRFYSISQQFSDGLLILAVLFIIYLSYQLSNILTNLSLSLNQKEEILTSKSLIMFIIIDLFSSIMFFLGSKGFYLKLYKEQFIDLTILCIFIVSSVCIIVPFIRAVIYIFKLLSKSFKILKKEKADSLLQFSLRIFGQPIFTVVVLFILIAITKLHSIYLIPDNLINSKKLIKNYISTNKLLPKDTVKILYLNDKYIFLKKNSEVEILKFEELFEKK